MSTGVTTTASPTPTRSLASAAFPAFRAGVLAALATWGVCLLPALVGWVAAPESSLGWFSAVSVASALWYLAHGQSVGADGLVVSLTPVLLTLGFVALVRAGAARLVSAQRALIPAAEWSHLVLVGIVPGFSTGYVAVAALIALTTLGGPLLPGVAAVVGSLLVPLVALGTLLLRPGSRDTPAALRRLVGRGPRWLVPAWGAGWSGAGLLLLAGGALALLRVLLSLGSVVTVQGEYHANAVAHLVLVLAQLALLGNAATWGLGYLAGPGFSLASDSSVSPFAAEPGLMPLVPVLGALPEPAVYAWPALVVLLVPVVVGGVVARRVDRAASARSGVRDRVVAALVALGVTLGACLAVTGLANGAVGVERLAFVGVPLLPLAGALAAELLVGGAVVLAWRLAGQRWRRSGIVLDDD